MAECPQIKLEQTRAKLIINGMTFGTPGCGSDIHGNLTSFSLSQARGQQVSTLQCTVEIWIKNPMGGLMTTSDGLGPALTLWAGTIDGMPQIFTGYIRSIKGEPSWTDSRKYVLFISAEDVFTRMRNHKYSRRFKFGDYAYAIIRDGKRRMGGRMEQLKYTPGRPVKFTQSGTNNNNDKHSPVAKTPDPNVRTPNGRVPKAQPKTKKGPFPIYSFQPSVVYLMPGQQAIISLYDEKGRFRSVGLSGQGSFSSLIDSARRGTCFMEPALENAGNVFRIITAGDPMFNSNTAGKFLVKLSTFQGFKGTFVDPNTNGIAHVNVYVIPIHDHSEPRRAGAGSAVYG